MSTSRQKHTQTISDPLPNEKGDGGNSIDLPRLLIRASAGTGKTFQLSSRYISLLRRSSPERILASTFTRKAAGEILERILLRLARATASKSSLSELAASIGASNLSRDECLQLLANLTRQLHRVRISTLDAFFAQLAGIYSLELGLPSGWRMLDPVEVREIRDQALERLLRDGDQQDLVQLMHLLNKGESSRSVSGLMRQTIDEMSSVFVDSSEGAWDRFPEYHFLSEGAREELLLGMDQLPLDQKRMATTRSKDGSAIREERWDDFLKKGLLPKIRSGERTYYNKPIPDALCEYYLRLSEHCLAVTATSWREQTRAAWRLLHDFHVIFNRMKLSSGGLEFGDITRRLAGSRTELESKNIAFRMDGAIEHLLLDEFQDTSRSQWNVIRPFAEIACSHPQRSFFCVGDVKQAIYAWRGGEAAIFDAIEEQLPGLTAQPLNLSYRSSPVVIDTVNQAMTQLHQHDNLDDHAEVLQEWCRAFPRHETTRKKLSGYCCLRTGPDAPEQEDGRPARREQRDLFWRFTADYVATLMQRSPDSTIGILTRTNATVGRLIFELSRLGIEASEEGGNPLTDSAAVQLVLSLMQLADHPGDTIAAFHVAHSPLGRVLGFENHSDPRATREFAVALRGQLVQRGYGGVVHDLAMRLSEFCDRRESRRLLQLASLADRFDSTFSTLRPGEFAKYARDQRCEEPTNSKIRVMNVHQSKGLEFDIVVLPELDSALIRSPRYVTKTTTAGSPPDLVALYRSEEHFAAMGGELLEARQQTRNRMVQESLCLLYVAMTRAARSLHMLIQPKTTARLPKSFAGLLRSALAPGVPLEPDTILWELGDPEWDIASRDVSAAQTPEKKSVVEPASTPVLKFASSTGRRHLRRTAPSDQVPDRQISLRPLASPSQQRITASQRGSLFHRWLEQIRWIDETPFEDEQLQKTGRACGLLEAELETQIQQFHSCLESPAIRNLLSIQGYEDRIRSAQPTLELVGKITFDVRTEFPFLQRTQSGELINGSIDRLVIINSDGVPVAAEVVDYKTDHIATPADVSRLVEHYRGQILAYREAVAKLLHLDHSKVIMRLAFLGVGEVVVVS